MISDIMATKRMPGEGTKILSPKNNKDLNNHYQMLKDISVKDLFRELDTHFEILETLAQDLDKYVQAPKKEKKYFTTLVNLKNHIFNVRLKVLAIQDKTGRISKEKKAHYNKKYGIETTEDVDYNNIR